MKILNDIIKAKPWVMLTLIFINCGFMWFFSIPDQNTQSIAFSMISVVSAGICLYGWAIHPHDME